MPALSFSMSVDRLHELIEVWTPQNPKVTDTPLRRGLGPVDFNFVGARVASDFSGQNEVVSLTSTAFWASTQRLLKTFVYFLEYDLDRMGLYSDLKKATFFSKTKGLLDVLDGSGLKDEEAPPIPDLIKMSLREV